jgi:hypothetical protein
MGKSQNAKTQYWKEAMDEGLKGVKGRKKGHGREGKNEGRAWNGMEEGRKEGRAWVGRRKVRRS